MLSVIFYAKRVCSTGRGPATDLPICFVSQATFDAIPLYITSGVTYHHAILQPSSVGYGIHAGIFLALPRNWAGRDSRIAQLWAPQYRI